MAEYILMVLEDEDAHASESPSAMAKLIARRQAFVARVEREGRLKDSGRFRPSNEGKRVTRGERGVAVEDGPFAAQGRALAAYYLIEAASEEEALALGADCPRLLGDAVAARASMKGFIEPHKAGRAGKVFAFVVLGKGATEEDWQKVMDRIDAETSGCFPPDAFLGGVRLHPPSKSAGPRGPRLAAFDGPFLESKEVIGGLFFMRMTSLDDAVRWASESRFVVHGSLEIRELWRS